MALLYHLMPKNIVGGVLYPLNQLREMHPQIYEAAMRKYEGRAEVTQRNIPLLNCLWNDVVFFTSVHPEAIRNGFIAAGSPWTPKKWVAVDPTVHRFDAQNTVIYNPNIQRAHGDYAFLPEQFSSFKAGKITTICQLPEPTQDYYRETAQRGEPIFAWRGLPHILHHGSVRIDDDQIIEV